MTIRKIIDYSITLIILIAFIIAGYLYLQKNKEVSHNQLNKIISNASQYNWLNPYSISKKTPYGFLEGREVTAQTMSDTPYVSNFEDKARLTSEGFQEDINLNADGPGGSTWGYIKKNEDKSQIIILLYTVTPSSSNSNEPLQFDCPCSIVLSVFVSNPFSLTGTNN